MKNSFKYLFSVASLLPVFYGTGSFADVENDSKFTSTDHGLYLLNTSGSNYVLLQAPSSLGSNYAFTFPTTAGLSGQILSTDGTGNLSWTSPFYNPMNQTGDIIFSSDTSGTPNRLNIGASDTFLRGGTLPSYSKINSTSFFTSGAAVQPGVAAGILPATGLPGFTDASDASSGSVGETMQAFVGGGSGPANWPAASNVYTDLATLTLTAGDWLIHASTTIIRNGATFSLPVLEIFPSATSGNSSAGGFLGITIDDEYQSVPTTFARVTLKAPTTRVKYDGTTMTIYDGGNSTYTGTGGVIRLKGYLDSFSGTPQYQAKFMAQRIR